MSKQRQQCYNVESSTTNNNINDNSRIFDMWHAKLGQPSANVVKRILDNNSISFESINYPYICSSCQIGKNTSYHLLNLLLCILSLLN